MAENLRTTRYQNGVVISHIDSTSNWVSDTIGGWCYYDNDSTTNVPFGKLYKGKVATSSENVCPTGWHVPTAAEFDTLINNLGGPGNYADNIKATGGAYWGPNDGWSYTNGTNQSGLSAVSTGSILHFSGLTSTPIGYSTFWWGSSLDPWTNTDCVALEIYLNGDDSYGYYYMNINSGNPIRCVMD